MIKSKRDRDKHMQCDILAKSISSFILCLVLLQLRRWCFLVFIKLIPFLNVFLLLL